MNLYHSKKGELIVSKINLNQGAIAINTFDDLVCSTHYQPYQIDTNLVNLKYFVKTLRSEPFLNSLNAIKSNGIKNEFTPLQIGILEFPLPPLPIQEKLVNDYEQKIKEAQEAETKANDLEKDIEVYLLDALGIEIEKPEEKQKDSPYKFLQFVALKDVSRWGVEFLKRSQEKPLLSSKFDMINLEDYVWINPRISFTNLSPDTEMTFIPMETVSDEYGELMEYRKTTVSKSKGYTRIEEGDLIWAKITPCMENGKSAIVKGLLNKVACGSTEFHVFRPKKEEINLDFLYHLLRMEYVKQNAKKYFTGSAGQQRVPKQFFEELEIPLPPLTIQNKIVNHIQSQKAEIKRLRALAEDLRTSAKLDFEQEIFN